MKIIVTGGAGFIGSAVARHIINDTSDHVLVLDSLTYAGNLESLAPIADSDRYAFELVDICERPALDRVFAAFKPDAVMHLAAESHVDRSIDGPAAFIETNIVGTYTLLEAARHYWQTLDETKNRRSASTIFRPMKSTATCTALTICSQKRLLRTKQPVLRLQGLQRSSGARLAAYLRSADSRHQLLEQLRPLPLPGEADPADYSECAGWQALPVYGNGAQVRDWLYVEDHARALYKVVTEGAVGETYNIGGHNERKNIDVVRTICRLLDELVPNKPGKLSRYEELITFVTDRPGHDMRYAIDASKLTRNWAGSRRKRSKAVSARPLSGTWPTKPGGAA